MDHQKQRCGKKSPHLASLYLHFRDIIGEMAISRRQFAQLLATTPLAAQQRPLTAQAVIERIVSNLAAPAQKSTLDGFKAGDPAAAITGIAATAMATMDVLSRAVR